MTNLKLLVLFSLLRFRFFLADFIERMFCNVESRTISAFLYSSTKNLITSDMLECSVFCFVLSRFVLCLGLLHFVLTCVTSITCEVIKGFLSYKVVCGNGQYFRIILLCCDFPYRFICL